MAAHAIGVDYGSNSVRALLVRCSDGQEVSEAVFDYPSGERGILLDPATPTLARQHPGDYTDGFLAVVAEVVTAGTEQGVDPADVVGIGIDTTGSTPLPVDAGNVPLGTLDAFRDDLDAQAWLWKDHTSHDESVEITELATERGEPYLRTCGGTYSSEWFWSKILRCRRVAPEVFSAAHTWVELADFVPAWATGVDDADAIVRGVCAAGHKAMFNERWGGLPSKDFLAALDPELAELRDRLYTEAVPSSEPVGTLAADVAEQVGLTTDVVVAAGAFDAHHGAVGAGVEPGTLVKIMGTSTCDITVWSGGEDEELPDVPGLCGVVPGSVLPDAVGIEAGQSAVGDIFAWSAEQASSEGFLGEDAHEQLSSAAAKLAPGESGLLALDWHNGNRTVLVDTRLTGLLVGQTLHTRPHETYRAHVEATAYGARRIVERLEEYGIEVGTVVLIGGIAAKNDVVNQIYADVLGREVAIGGSDQACALGASVFGAVVGGAHPDTAAARAAMASGTSRSFQPDPAASATYDQLYGFYRTLHDAFGDVATDDPAARVAAIGDVMPDLMDLRDRVRAGESA